MQVKTTDDLIEVLKKYPGMSIFQAFEAGGNEYYSAPTVKEGETRNGESVIVLGQSVIPSSAWDEARDLVKF